MIDCENDLLLDSILRNLSRKAFNLVMQTDIKTSNDFLILNEKDLNYFGASPKVVDELIKVRKLVEKERSSARFVEKGITKAVKDEKNITKEDDIKIKADAVIANEGYRKIYNGRIIENFNKYLAFPVEELTIKPWSILNKSIASIVEETFSFAENFDSLTEYQKLKIIDLGLTKHDAQVLWFQGFLPEDPLEFLLHLTLIKLVYLGLENGFYIRFFEYLKKSFSVNIPKYLSENSREATFILNDLLDDSLLNVEVQIPRELGLKKSGSTSLKTSVKDIGEINEHKILKNYGLNQRSIQVLVFFWMVSNELSFLRYYLSESCYLYDYSSIDDYLSACVDLVCIKESSRNGNIFKQRIGLYNGHPYTLQEIAENVSMTRERVRQILSKCIKHFKSTNNIFHHLNLLMIESANKNGGALRLSEFINQVFEGDSGADPIPLLEILSFLKLYGVEIKDGVIIRDNYPCLRCKEWKKSFLAMVIDSGPGVVSFDKAIIWIKDYCYNASCAFNANIENFSYGFIQTVDIPGVFKDESLNFYSGYEYTFYSATKSEKCEIVLKELKKPAHFSEVYEHLLIRDPGESFSKISVHNSLSSSENVLLWGKGIFIHKCYVPLNEKIFSEIELFLVNKLDGNTPLYYIHGAYNYFDQKLNDIQVPNVQALYSCLKIKNNENLIFSDFPYVQLESCGYEARPTVQSVVSEFIKLYGKSIKKKHLLGYAIEEIGMTEQIFTSSVLPHLPEVIRCDKDEYIHIENIEMDKSKITPIYDYLHEVVSKFSHISIHKVFKDKRVTCASIGITNPVYLYYLLKYYYSEQFSFNNFPQVSDNTIDSITEQIINYIKSKESPCSYQELKKHFSGKLGYSENFITMVKTNDQIVKYSNTSVTHLDSIQWDEEKSDKIDALVDSYLTTIEKSGRLYGKISDFYNIYFNNLPEIHTCNWTTTLFTELLGDKFLFLGNKKDAFTFAENTNDIHCFEDLIYQIIVKEYDGAANLNDFRVSLIERGLISNQLTKHMLKPGKKVEILENMIKIKEAVL